MATYKLGSNTGKEQFSSFSEKGLLGGKIVTTSQVNPESGAYREQVAYKVKKDKDRYKKAMLETHKSEKSYISSNVAGEEIYKPDKPHETKLTVYKKSGEEKKRKFYGKKAVRKYKRFARRSARHQGGSNISPENLEKKYPGSEIAPTEQGIISQQEPYER